MALEFQTFTVTFDPTQGRRQREPGFVNFSRPVRTAQCAVKGFNANYPATDRRYRELEIDIDGPTISGTQVSFEVDLALRDNSGTFDDRYGGFVEVLVIAD